MCFPKKALTLANKLAPSMINPLLSLPNPTGFKQRVRIHVEPTHAKLVKLLPKVLLLNPMLHRNNRK